MTQLRRAWPQAAAKAQPGKAILITGSRTLWNDLLAHDLVDEIHLLVGNRILGEGIPFLPPGVSTRNLRLVETRPFQSGVVYLRYQRLQI